MAADSTKHAINLIARLEGRDARAQWQRCLSVLQKRNLRKPRKLHSSHIKKRWSRARIRRLESEKQAQRRAVEWKADFQLDHIARYLEKEYEFDGGYAERHREADRLRPLIREGLIDELLEHPDMSYDEIQESIEDQVDERI